MLEYLFKNIDKVTDKKDRDKISKLFQNAGGMTVSFHIIAEKLLKFVIKGTKELNEIAKNNPERINIGSSKIKKKYLELKQLN